MRRPLTAAALLTTAGVLALLFASAAPAPAPKVVFWHYLASQSAINMLDKFAAEFNKSQSRVEIVPQGIGDPKTLAVKTVASLRAGGLPTMMLADNIFFNRLAIGGQLRQLDDLTAELPAGTANDFYPSLWNYGSIGGKRYGLPWAASTLVLYYNADALRARNMAPPRSWDDFAKAAKALTSRSAKGAIFITDLWFFQSLVTSRGGTLFTPDNKPLFNGPDSVEALNFLSGLAKAGYLTPRTLDELPRAASDFLFTKALMVVGPTSAFPLAEENSFAFKIGAVALPGRTVSGEGQVVIFRTADPALQRGAFDFWQYLMRPENLSRWVKESYYLPARRSVTASLADFIKSQPVMEQGLIALDRSISFPHAAELNEWQLVLDAALERALKGASEPARALEEAQRASVAK